MHTYICGIYTNVQSCNSICPFATRCLILSILKFFSHLRQRAHNELSGCLACTCKNVIAAGTFPSSLLWMAECEWNIERNLQISLFAWMLENIHCTMMQGSWMRASLCACVCEKEETWCCRDMNLVFAQIRRVCQYYYYYYYFVCMKGTSEMCVCVYTLQTCTRNLIVASICANWLPPKGLYARKTGENQSCASPFYYVTFAIYPRRCRRRRRRRRRRRLRVVWVRPGRIFRLRYIRAVMVFAHIRKHQQTYARTLKHMCMCHLLWHRKWVSNGRTEWHIKPHTSEDVIFICQYI